MGHRSGFTLVELMVVIGIIILIAAVSVPAFRFITGSKSIDSAQNVINAMVSRARSASIVNGQTYGVFFFLDPRNDRSTLALVQQNNSNAEYSGWSQSDTAGQTGDPQTGTTVSAGPPVYYFDSTIPDVDPSNALQTVVTSEFVAGTSFHRCAPLVFQCIKPHQAPNNQMQFVPAYSSTFWNANSGGLEIVRDSELQMLPPGVGLYVVVDAQIALRGTGAPGTQRLGINRYLRTGCILFDGLGRFTNVQYDVYNSSHLGQALLLDNLTGTPIAGTQKSLSVGQDASNPIPLFSGFGVVLYDRQAFLADAKAVGYTEGDYLFGDALTSGSLHLPLPPYGPEPAPEANLTPGDINDTPIPKLEFVKQWWIDANGTLLTASRGSGALIKSE